MSVFTLGLNHTTAPLDLRGRFAFSLEQLAPTLQTFRQGFAGIAKAAAPEAAILSTCSCCARRWSGWPRQAASAPRR